MTLRAALATLILSTASFALSLPVAAQGDPAMAARIEALLPDLEAYVAKGLADFDVPGAAIGIVAGDALVYAKGFGLHAKGGDAVDPGTVFQIGSTTKAFLATSLAIAVDQDKLAWDDRVVDHAPDFQMMDPWVTQEFRIFDLLAQRSGLPPYANDAVGLLGFDQTAMIRSLRHVAPVSSFRSTFAYTNITHMLAQRIVAAAMGAADWNEVIASEIFEPLGMTGSSFTAAAIETAPNAAKGYLWTPDGSTEVPFTEVFPYGFGAAGAINSNIEDMSGWLRLQLANGNFEGQRIVSADNLAVTLIPRIGISPTAAYAMGWVDLATPNGRVVWHNGGTTAFGAYVGLLPDHDAGVVVLTNATNVGLPDAIGAWALDRLLGNPEIDHAARSLAAARDGAAADSAPFVTPADARPAPPLEALAGTYDNPTFDQADLAVADGALSLVLAGTGARLSFAAWDGDVFTVRLAQEGRFEAVAANLGADPLGFAQFQVGSDGRRSRLVLTPTESGQTYLFARR